MGVYKGLGFRVKGFGFRVQGSSLRFKVHGIVSSRFGLGGSRIYGQGSYSCRTGYRRSGRDTTALNGWTL